MKSVNRELPVKMPVLPSPDRELQAEYHRLIDEIDQRVTELSGKSFVHLLQCRPGCSECCVQFSVLPLEAALVKERMQQGHLPVEGGDLCILLDDDMCSVYDIRPIICRTQGLPLAYVDEASGTIEVSACQRNFPDDYPFEENELLFMDAFNTRLATLNLQYCRSAGLDPWQRIALVDLGPKNHSRPDPAHHRRVL